MKGTMLSSKQRFLSACRREEVDFTPVWFMRQAGRYLEGYRQIRKSYEVLEICRTPSICEDVTVMPVKELGVDAAVLFADIMLPLEGMGVKFKIEENTGPIISNPIVDSAEVEKLRDFDARMHVPFVFESISRIRDKLDRTGHALIGFSGAPFTLASYMIEGRPSRDFAKTKRLMYEDRDTWDALFSKLSEMIISYLSAQIEAGVDAVQIFDSWIGCLSLNDYRKFVFPHVNRIFRSLKKDHADTPTIHFGTNTYHLLRAMNEAGGDVASIDWRIPIISARKIVDKSTGIQGNLDPAVLLSKRRNLIEMKTQEVLDDNADEEGHVFNLGHGILRDTPVENAKLVVKYVHEKS